MKTEKTFLKLTPILSIILLAICGLGKAYAVPIKVEYSVAITSHAGSVNEIDGTFPIGTAISGSLQVDSDDLLDVLQGTLFPKTATGSVTSNGKTLTASTMETGAGYGSTLRAVEVFGTGDTFSADGTPPSTATFEVLVAQFLLPFNITDLSGLLSLTETSLNAALAAQIPNFDVLDMGFERTPPAVASYAQANNYTSFRISLASVPGPATLALLGIGLASLGFARRRAKA